MSSAEIVCGQLPVVTDFRTLRWAIESVRPVPELAQILTSKRREGSRGAGLDRRVWNRYEVAIPVRVCPVEFDGDTALLDGVTGGELLATTRDLSLRGVGFVHELPLEAAYAMVTFELPNGPLSLLLEVRWANRAQEQGYMSGGMFLGVVGPPACR